MNINVCVDNKSRDYYLKEGYSGIVLEDIIKDFENEYKGYITIANINNKLRELYSKFLAILCLFILIFT